MGADHVETITRAVSGAEICAVADIDPKRAENAASRVPGAKAFASAELLIESPEVDAVIIASSDATHAQYVTACISVRKPVLCEKPLAPTVAECEQILHLEESAALRLVQVGFMRRFDPGYVELRGRIAAGEVGTPVLAHCVHRNVDVPESLDLGNNGGQRRFARDRRHALDFWSRHHPSNVAFSKANASCIAARPSSGDYGTRGRRSCL